MLRRPAPLIVVLAVLALVSRWASAAVPAGYLGYTVPAEQSLLATLRPGHPRLVVLPDDLTRTRELLRTNLTAQTGLRHLEAEGRAVLKRPPIQRVLIGPRLLGKSRTLVERMYLLGLLYRLDGNRTWADRAVKEMLAAAAFKDWNPSHFLDVAEMTHGLAIGYDWFYDVLTPDQRQTVKVALLEKGLLVAKAKHEANAWPFVNNHNWNNVCNGGISVGALAVADEEPALARYLLHQALVKLPNAMQSYGPDGGWVEGPGYWGYATRYTVYALAALQSALGTDFGLSGFPGFDRAGFFRVAAVGPTHRYFNFADAGEKAGSDSSLFWLARRFQQPALAVAQRRALGAAWHPLDLVWFDARGTDADLARLPLDQYYTGTDVVLLRSDWLSEDAVFVGFKGGNNAANHSNLDLGSFVLDALGERWACDLGSDDYNLPGYFGNRRWTYYRLKTEGHNTLTVGNANQDPKATAPIRAFSSGPDGGFAVADLTKGYAAQGVQRAWRGMALRDRRQRVLVQDEVELTQPGELLWAMHTPAKVTLDGSRATLKQHGKTLEARLLSPANARFEVAEVKIAAPQKQLKESLQKLLVRVPAGAGTATRIAVLFTPAGADFAAEVQLFPLSEWRK